MFDMTTQTDSVWYLVVADYWHEGCVVKPEEEQNNETTNYRTSSEVYLYLL